MLIGPARLAAQHIDSPNSTSALDVVRWMGAVQAQDYGQSLWAIGLRMGPLATVEAIRSAIEAGRIIRTWPMRGTIHFVPAEDAAWMLKLTAQRVMARDQRRLDELDITHAVLDQSTDIIVKALQGSKRIARPALMRTLEAAGIATANQRGYHIIWRLAQAGHIYIGPLEEKQPTYALLSELTKPRELSYEASLAELATRYFQSHGPATCADFATWSGLTLREATTAADLIQSKLVIETFAQRRLMHIPSSVPASAQTLHLLAGYDEYLLGYKDRSDVLPSHLRNPVVASTNGVFFPLIVAADGQVVGTWKRIIKSKSIVIYVDARYRKQVAFRQAIDRYGFFMGLPIMLHE